MRKRPTPPKCKIDHRGRKKRVDICWLIPAEPYRELFRNLIRILAWQFDAPPFEPHLTLGRAQDRHPPKRRRIRLPIREIGFSAKYTQTLFVRFAPDESLRKLVVDLGGKPIRDPHLSLIYKHLPAATKRELVKTLRLPFRSVVFDVVKIARCTSPTRTRRDVESWRLVA